MGRVIQNRFQWLVMNQIRYCIIIHPKKVGILWNRVKISPEIFRIEEMSFQICEPFEYAWSRYSDRIVSQKALFRFLDTEA